MLQAKGIARAKALWQEAAKPFLWLKRVSDPLTTYLERPAAQGLGEYNKECGVYPEGGADGLRGALGKTDKQARSKEAVCNTGRKNGGKDGAKAGAKRVAQRRKVTGDVKEEQQPGYEGGR